jgi:aspartyl-tRNA(Asn)/glutamyl-tRNA(Gln) amidotransferase subunit C
LGGFRVVAISREDVLHVAALAQLDLSEAEIARLTVELTDILAAVGKVSELDLSDVPPTSHPLAVVNVFRPDEPRPSLPLDDVFANAPERDADYFRVPPTGAAEESSA